MSENPKLNPTRESGEAPKDALLEIAKKLGLSEKLVYEISKLTGEKKDLCIISLEDIVKEIEDGKLGESDKNQKINDTLALEYNIIQNKNDSNTGSTRTLFSKIDTELNNSGNEFNLEYKKLKENLENVKKLDEGLSTPVISDELAKAKVKTPLPPDAKIAIAKASNIPLEKLDEAIQQGDNPALSNLVDTYYLTQENTIQAISSRLPDEKKNTIVFQELRASAREFGIPYSERADNVKALVSNKSDATQAKVVETVGALTKGAPETLVTRTGDKLSFNNPKDKNSRYEIDVGQNPPRLKKIVGNLSITREIPDSNNQVMQGELVNQQKDARNSVGQSVEKFRSLEAMSRESGTDMEKYLTELYSTDSSIKTTRDEIKKRIKETKTPEASLLAFQELLKSNTAIQVISKDGSFLTVERAQKPEAQLIGRILGDESIQLEDIIKKLESYIKTTKRIDDTPQSNLMGLSEWETSADKSLGILNNTGYGYIGQDLTEKIIDAINLKKGWKNTKNEINLNKNPILEKYQEDELILGLARLTRVNNTMPTWNNVDPNDRIIAERQLTSGDGGKNALITVRKLYETDDRTRSYWSTSESLGNWLYQDTANQEEKKDIGGSNSAINTQGEKLTTFA